MQAFFPKTKKESDFSLFPSPFHLLKHIGFSQETIFSTFQFFPKIQIPVSTCLSRLFLRLSTIISAVIASSIMTWTHKQLSINKKRISRPIHY